MSKPSAVRKKRTDIGELTRITKTPMELEHNGETYILAPLEVSDLGRIEVWIAELPLRKAKRQLLALGDVVTEEVTTRVLNDALAKSDSQINISSDEAQAELNSLAGVGFLLYLSLRKNHPEIEEQDALDMLTMETLSDFKDTLDLANSLFPTTPKVKVVRK